MTPEELKGIGEDANDDQVERLAEKRRRQRLEEINRAESSRFGRVYPIGRDDYTREVTEASKVAVPGDPGKGTGVVCLLYRDGCALSRPDFPSSHRLPGCRAVSGHSNMSGFLRSVTQRQSLSPLWETNAYRIFPSQGNPC
jgi:hypothetical protein